MIARDKPACGDGDGGGCGPLTTGGLPNVMHEKVNRGPVGYSINQSINHLGRVTAKICLDK